MKINKQIGIDEVALKHLNCLRPHGAEGWTHWLTKAIVFKLLWDNKKKQVSEANIPEGKIDVINLTDRAFACDHDPDR